MTIDVSKTNFGAIVGPDAGVTVSKANFGVIIGQDGVTISRLTFGVIVDTQTPESGGRRRQIVNC